MDLWLKANNPIQAIHTSAFASSLPGNYVPYFQFAYNGSSVLRFDGGYNHLYLDIGSATGAWQHVAVTYDDSDDLVTTYLNGVFSNSATWPSAAGTLAFQVVKIGSNRDASRGFDGLIDEVELYKRPLSAGDIFAIYEAGANRCKP